MSFNNSLSVDKKSFNEIFPNYDYDFLNQLFNSWDQNEGSTFGWDNMNGSFEQILMHKKVFLILKPTNIIEIGTHKGSYSYFAKMELPDCKIWTFGIDPESKHCTDLINKHFKEKFITFIEGDSKKTMPNFNEDIKFDLAWLDGDHNYEGAISDLRQCERLNINNILVDDLSMDIVRSAVNDFVKKSKYTLIEESKDSRIIGWLAK
jgi:cephalosporin hydroxylase